MTDRKSTWDLHQRRKCNSYNSIRHLITRSADSSLPMSVASRSPNVEASFFVYMCFQLTISLFLLISQNRILLFAIASRDNGGSTNLKSPDENDPVGYANFILPPAVNLHASFSSFISR